jgi:hypothetical protein
VKGEDYAVQRLPARRFVRHFCSVLNTGSAYGHTPRFHQPSLHCTRVFHTIQALLIQPHRRNHIHPPRHRRRQQRSKPTRSDLELHLTRHMDLDRGKSRHHLCMSHRAQASSETLYPLRVQQKARPKPRILILSWKQQRGTRREQELKPQSVEVP